jgi:tetratricopeptide (TPR) repeat protein
MRNLAAADPGNAGWQRDLSVSLEKVGDVRFAAGDRAGALAVYEESLAIRRKLAVADPGNSDWQRDVAVGLNKVADVQFAVGNRAGALSAYDESVAIRRKLATADPGNAGWQADLVISLYKVSTASDPPQARAALTQALGIAEALAREGKLRAAQQDWPQLLRDALAKLPPESAEAR